jgi:hypothetical protein
MSHVPPPDDGTPPPRDDGTPPPPNEGTTSRRDDGVSRRGDDTMADDSGSRAFEENVKRRSTWLRLLFMIVLWVLYQVAEFVVGVVIIVQFLWVLFTGKKNVGLVEFGASLSTYVYQILAYLTFTTEQRPFPFDLRWPAEPPER